MTFTTKLLFVCVCATIFALTTGFSGARATPQPNTPLRGGKPKAPIDIRALPVAPIEAGADGIVTFEVIPLSNCLSISWRLRGLDGAVIPDESLRTEGECVRGKTLRIGTPFKIAADLQGAVAIDVELRTSEGELAASRSTPVSGATAIELKSKTNGNLRTDSNGERLVVTPAESLTVPVKR